VVSLLIACMVSLFVSDLIIRLSRSRALAWHDHDLQGVQKFHAGAVPRVGGRAVGQGGG
jgi:UDP-N-acetylmuramyl pentapeptide phosphotransferase/UDP-N-acetylglucosamine-1-phosphate transferase